MSLKKINFFDNRPLSSLINCGVHAEDSNEQILNKQVLTLLPLIIGFAATIWGLIYFVLGHYLSAAIPLSYALISALSLWYFSYSKSMRFLRISQLTLILILPFLLMWSLGGFAAGSYVMIWAFYAPLGAMSFSKDQAAKWFFLFILLTFFSALIDKTLIQSVETLPLIAIDIFALLNIAAGFGGIFFIMSHYMKELKHTSSELSVLNHELEEKIASAIKKNEESHELILRQSKLASMGEMISMIAHQWRQPLSSISAINMNLQINIEMDKYDKNLFMKKFDDIHDIVQHLSQTINDFRDFFKPDKTKISFMITHSISNALNIIQSLFISNNIEVITHLDTDKEITSFENELIQVLINILKNSIDALTEGAIKNPQIIIRLYEDKNKNIILSIEDNAGGVPDEIIKQIFDPYFSTKSKNGTGLGLYMSKMIIEEHCDAQLNIRNSENGACFTIRFPFNDEETLSCLL